MRKSFVLAAITCTFITSLLPGEAAAAPLYCSQGVVNTGLGYFPGKYCRTAGFARIGADCVCQDRANWFRGKVTSETPTQAWLPHRAPPGYDDKKRPH